MRTSDIPSCRFLLAQLEHRCRLELVGAHGAEGLGAEVPPVRREQPRPAEQVARAEAGDGDPLLRRHLLDRARRRRSGRPRSGRPCRPPRRSGRPPGRRPPWRAPSGVSRWGGGRAVSSFIALVMTRGSSPAIGSGVFPTPISAAAAVRGTSADGTFRFPHIARHPSAGPPRTPVARVRVGVGWGKDEGMKKPWLDGGGQPGP